MDDEARKLLLEVKKLSQENHTMLRKIRSTQKNARMMKSIYWVVMLGLTYAAYAYVRPYIQQGRDFYDAAQVQIESFKNFGSTVQKPN